jgi:hypothetical protein
MHPGCCVSTVKNEPHAKIKACGHLVGQWHLQATGSMHNGDSWQLHHTGCTYYEFSDVMGYYDRVRICLLVSQGVCNCAASCSLAHTGDWVLPWAMIAQPPLTSAECWQLTMGILHGVLQLLLQFGVQCLQRGRKTGCRPNMASGTPHIVTITCVNHT